MRTWLSIFLILFLSACASAPTATAQPTSAPTAVKVATVAPTQVPAGSATPQPAATGTPQKTLSLTIVKLDGSKVSLTLDDLKKLTLADVTISGKVNEGYKLKDILAAAGVTKYLKVTISGDGAKVRLDLNAVDDNTLLSFTDSGNLKLVTTNINKQFWPQNVNLLEVQ